MTRAALTSFGGKLGVQLAALAVSRGLLLVTTVLFSREVGTDHYGIFVVAWVVFQAGLYLRDAGLGQALIVLGRPGTHGGSLRAFWWASSLGITLSIFMGAVAEPLTSLVGLPEAAEQLRILALAFGIGSLGVISNASLERGLRFHLRAVVDVASYGALAAGTAVGISLGWEGQALAWGYVAQGSVQATLALLLAPPWRDKGGGHSPVTRLARYASLLWVVGLLGYLASNLDNVVVARLGDAYLLGIYALSYTVGTTVSLSLAQAVNRLALPYYARTQSLPDLLPATAQSMTTLAIGIAALPALVIIALAPEISDYLFRSTVGVLPLVLLSAYAIARSFALSLGTVLSGVGLAARTVVGSTLNVALIAVGLIPSFVTGGLPGVASTVLVAMTATAIYLMSALRGRTQANFSFVAGVAALLTGVSLLVLPEWNVPSFLRVLAAIASSVVVVVWMTRIVEKADFLSAERLLGRASS